MGRAGDLTDDRDRKLYRILEILPGLSAWLTIFLIILLLTVLNGRFILVLSQIQIVGVLAEVF